MGWFKCVAALAILIPLGSDAVGQTAAADGPVIEKPGSCAPLCTYLVNRNLTSRVVVTLEATPTPNPFGMYDNAGNQAPLMTTTVPVLLQAGERRMLNGPIVYAMRSSVREQATLDYRILGSYIPKPDLSDLPAGVPEDFARFFVQWDHDFDNSPACGLGLPAKGLRVRNMNQYRSLAVTYQNKRPGLNNSEQTIYLQPGQDLPVGCVNDWPVLTVSGIRFAS